MDDEWQIELNSKVGHKHITGPDTIGVLGQLTRVRVVRKETCMRLEGEVRDLKHEIGNLKTKIALQDHLYNKLEKVKYDLEFKLNYWKQKAEGKHEG